MKIFLNFGHHFLRRYEGSIIIIKYVLNDLNVIPKALLCLGKHMQCNEYLGFWKK